MVARTLSLRHVALPLLASLVLSVGACAAPTDAADDGAGSADAVTVQEVVADGAQALLTDYPAGSAAKRELGIVKWSLFLVNDEDRGFDGAVAYGTDANDQIVFSVASVANQADYEASQTKFAAIRFDLDGPSEDQEIDLGTRKILDAEIQALARALQAPAASDGDLHTSTSRAKNAGFCAFGIASTLLIGVALAAPLALLPEVFAGATALEIGISVSATAGLVTGAGAIAGKIEHVNTLAVAGAIVKLAGMGVAATGHACAAAATGH
jgi:hypothetical protein